MGCRGENRMMNMSHLNQIVKRNESYFSYRKSNKAGNKKRTAKSQDRFLVERLKLKLYSVQKITGVT